MFLVCTSNEQTFFDELVTEKRIYAHPCPYTHDATHNLFVPTILSICCFQIRLDLREIEVDSFETASSL